MNGTSNGHFNILLMLTSSGMNFFIQRKLKITKFQNPEGGFEFGVSMDNFSPSFIQKMILEGYVARLEVSAAEFTSRRQEIIDITKLIVYGILYRQFNSVLFIEIILQSKLIKDYNRAKPGNLIDERTQFDRRIVDDFLKTNQEKMESIKKTFLSPVILKLQSDTGLQQDERNRKYQICEKFLNCLPGHVWYILINFQSSRDFVMLLSEIRTCLLSYLAKTSVAEFLALMLIELLSYAQNKNIQNYIQKRYANNISLETLIADPHLRRKVLEELEKNNEKLYLSWKISPIHGAKSEHNKLDVTIFNREAEYKKFKEEIDTVRDVNLDKKNIVDYCKENPEQQINPELGFLYISYLSDECRRVNIRFDSYVHQIAQRDLTVITSCLHF